MTDETTTDGTTQNDGGQQSEPSNEVSFTADQQSAIDKIISDRLGRAKSKWQEQLETEKAKAEQEAEAKRLEEKEQYKELAEKYKAQLADVMQYENKATELGQQVEQYQAMVNNLLDQRLKELGDTAKNAVSKLPGQPDALEKLEWLNDNIDLFQAKQEPKGTPPKRGRRLSGAWQQQAPREPTQPNDFIVKL